MKIKNQRPVKSLPEKGGFIMELKAVFFDLDDTLYGNFKQGDDYGYDCMGEYAQSKLGIPKDDFIKAARASRRELGRRQPGLLPPHNRALTAQVTLEHFGLNPARHVKALHDIYWKSMFEKMELRPGVIELLDRLKDAGVKTAVCTDMISFVQFEKLNYLGLSDKIDFLASSEETGVDKPAPPIFWLALHKCKCTAEEAVMVGDNFRHDIQGALDLGIKGVWLNWSKLPRPDETRDYFEAQTFTEASDYILKLINEEAGNR